ncbi:MAG: hypothetical protein OEV92_05165 [Nitrospinota bacterium]|nr:hypothetical protein [Nitrospinota bacterium]
MIKVMATFILAAYTLGIFMVHQTFTLRMKALNNELAAIEHEIDTYKKLQKKRVEQYIAKKEMELEECLAFTPMENPPARPGWRERIFGPKSAPEAASPADKAER